jgi:cell division septum initiation protein DivIVA
LTNSILQVLASEKEAEALLEQAQDYADKIIQDAYADRDKELENIRVLPVDMDDLKLPRSELTQLRSRAQKNKAKVIRSILEELHEV